MTTDTTTAATSPGAALSAGLQEFRLDIVTGPDPDSPVAIVWFRADGIAAAIAQAHRYLAVHDGPADRYGELSMRNGRMADFLTTIHLGA